MKNPEESIIKVKCNFEDYPYESFEDLIADCERRIGCHVIANELLRDDPYVTRQRYILESLIEVNGMKKPQE